MITRVLSLIAMLLLSVPAIAQSTTKQKVQQAEGRIKFNGMSVKRTTTPKLLVLENNGEEVKKNWEDLSQADIQALAAEFERCDLEQFQLVQPNLAQLVANPQATIDILRSLHARMYESPTQACGLPWPCRPVRTRSRMPIAYYIKSKTGLRSNVSSIRKRIVKRWLRH